MANNCIELNLPCGQQFILNNTFRIGSDGRLNFVYTHRIKDVKDTPDKNGVTLTWLSSTFAADITLHYDDIEKIAYQLLGINASNKSKEKNDDKENHAC